MQYRTDSTTPPVTPDNIIGQSAAIKTICQQAKQIAPTNCTVLVVGETGTGKGLIAQLIYDLSDRTDQPLIVMNCGTPPETTVEAEIFGYHKKTLTGYSEPSLEHLIAVNGATLMVDEISELSPEGQAHFLEVLELIEKLNSASTQQQAIDIRLIITSQHDLKQLVMQDKFNKRLFYHLSVFTLTIPPLRERGEDKAKISNQLLQESCIKYDRPQKSFSKDAISAISSYNWPGNYRELRNTIERAVLLSLTDTITKAELDLQADLGEALIQQPGIPSTQPNVAEPSPPENDQNLSLEDYFQHFVLEHQDQMTETELAQKLGISRKCLWERRQRYDIPRRKPGTK